MAFCNQAFSAAMLAALVVSGKPLDVMIANNNKRRSFGDAGFHRCTMFMREICGITARDGKTPCEHDNLAGQRTVSVAGSADGGSGVRVDGSANAAFPIGECNAAMFKGVQKDQATRPCIMKSVVVLKCDAESVGQIAQAIAGFCDIGPCPSRHHGTVEPTP